MSGDGDAPGDVYFEFTAIGGSVKVTAIDAATATEVTVIGPTSAARFDLQRLALQKLRVKMKKAAT